MREKKLTYHSHHLESSLLVALECKQLLWLAIIIGDDVSRDRVKKGGVMEVEGYLAK